MNNTSTVAEMNLSCGEPPSAKLVWKNAVEQHTFFRLTQPDPPSRIQTLLRRGSKFRYSGRTLRQTQKAKLDRPDHNFTRYVVYLSTLYHALLDSRIILQGEKFYETVSLFLTFCVILYHTLIIRKVWPGNEATLSYNRTLCYY